MGRKRQGPVRINNGLTWYCRLHIPEKLRGLAGKTRLIRSLETTDHNTALKRYGHVIQQLEDELQHLLSDDTLRQKVNNYQDSGLHPAEAAELILGVKELDPSSSTHESIYNAVAFGNELPISWDELIELWITTRNRTKARDLSAESINSARTAISQIKSYGQPSELTKQSVQRFIDEFPGKATTVQTRCRMLSAMMEVVSEKIGLMPTLFSRLISMLSNDLKTNVKRSLMHSFGFYQNNQAIYFSFASLDYGQVSTAAGEVKMYPTGS